MRLRLRLRVMYLFQGQKRIIFLVCLVENQLAANPAKINFVLVCSHAQEGRK